jgi:hypothetical protein
MLSESTHTLHLKSLCTVELCILLQTPETTALLSGLIRRAGPEEESTHALPPCRTLMSCEASSPSRHSPSPMRPQNPDQFVVGIRNSSVTITNARIQHKATLHTQRYRHPQSQHRYIFQPWLFLAFIDLLSIGSGNQRDGGDAENHQVNIWFSPRTASASKACRAS